MAYLSACHHCSQHGEPRGVENGTRRAGTRADCNALRRWLLLKHWQPDQIASPAKLLVSCGPAARLGGLILLWMNIFSASAWSSQTSLSYIWPDHLRTTSKHIWKQRGNSTFQSLLWKQRLYIRFFSQTHYGRCFRRSWNLSDCFPNAHSVKAWKHSYTIWEYSSPLLYIQNKVWSTFLHLDHLLLHFVVLVKHKLPLWWS